MIGFYVDDEGLLKYDYVPTRYANATIKNITAISCNGYRINGTYVGVLAGTIQDSTLNIEYFTGRDANLGISYLRPVPEDEKHLFAIHRSMLNDSLTFFTIVNSTLSKTELTCYVYSLSLQMISLVQVLKIGSDYQFMDNRLRDQSYIFWQVL